MDNSKEIEKTAEPEEPEVRETELSGKMDMLDMRQIDVRKQSVEQSNIPYSPAMVIQTIMTMENIDLAKLEKFMELQERHEANEARKAFSAAFSRVQENIGLVVKTRVNAQTHSKYADLGDISESTKPIYTKEGFAFILYEGETSLPGHIRIYADVLHSSGHKETYHLDMPLDGVGLKGNANMTAIHGKGSAISYCRRYLACMVWNIATGDDDGNVAGVKIEEYITDEQKGIILDLITVTESDINKFLKYMKIESLETMPASAYNKAIMALDTKAKVKK